MKKLSNDTFFCSKRDIGWKDHHLSENWWCFHSNNDVFTLKSWRLESKRTRVREKWNQKFPTQGKSLGNATHMCAITYNSNNYKHSAHSSITYGWYCFLKGFPDHSGARYNFQSRLPQVVDYSPLCSFHLMYQNRYNYPHLHRLVHHVQDYWKCDSKCNNMLDNKTKKLPYMNLGQTCKYLKN